MDNISFQREILEELVAAHRYNNWIVSKFQPYLKGEILEIGSGLGNITKLLLKRSSMVTASEIDPRFIAILNKDFAKAKYLDIKQIDWKNWDK